MKSQKGLYVKEKMAFWGLMATKRFLVWEMKQYGQEFYGIWYQPRVNNTCIMLRVGLTH